MNPSSPQSPYPQVSVTRPTPSRSQPASGADDASLLRRMALGDQQALSALYERWHPLVHGVVLRIVRQPTDVEEVVEESFWQAWRQSGRYESNRGPVQVWLATIARSRALDRVRSQKRLREEPLNAGDGTPAIELVTNTDPAMDAETAERRRLVLAALTELPPDQREALELGYFGGLSQSEIARRTGRPVGTIKTQMRLAMQKLRGTLRILTDEGSIRK